MRAAGGLDLQARFLALYRPPAYLTGCSQVVWPGEEPMLVRNYDYSPALCEGLILLSRWNGRAVLAMVDCLWGVLDGINDAGLAVSLTFGGRKVVGDGFGIPIVLRYILEFCDTAEQAGEVHASRVPVHMSYNVTAVDRRGKLHHRLRGARPQDPGARAADRRQPPGQHRLAQLRPGDRDPGARALPLLPAARAGHDDWSA